MLDPELKLFYDYIRRGTPDSALTGRIESSINKLKENTDVRRKYMTYTTRIAEAKSEAFEEGIAIGEERGISLGAYQKAIETARKFLSMGLSVEQVANGTGLSVEEIEKL